MKISAKEVAPDVYSVSFDETEIILEGGDVKSLLMRLMQVITPADTGGVRAVSKDDRKRTDFLNKISAANDLGIQKLLLLAAHEDLLVLLKCAAADQALQDRFFGNMSENNAKMFNEDLAFEFRDGLPEKQRNEALDRLIKLTRQLAQDGELEFANAAGDQATLN